MEALGEHEASGAAVTLIAISALVWGRRWSLWSGRTAGNSWQRGMGKGNKGMKNNDGHQKNIGLIISVE